MSHYLVCKSSLDFKGGALGRFPRSTYLSWEHNASSRVSSFTYTYLFTTPWMKLVLKFNAMSVKYSSAM